MKVDEYRQQLKSLKEWDTFLLRESRLPGPRGNLELARAVALEGNKPLFLGYIACYPNDRAPTNTPEEFLAFCGILGLGVLLACGDSDVLKTLRQSSRDSRWRTREAVAHSLQIWGEQDMDGLLREMTNWARGDYFEQRAAAAALCEPGLLVDQKNNEAVLEILNTITVTITESVERHDEGFKALKKCMGYAWSVAIAASPAAGKPRLEYWLESDDKDIRRIMKENLKKKRLVRLDPDWVNRCQIRLS